MKGASEKASGRQRRSIALWGRARRVLDKHCRNILRRVGVVGVDVGVKRIGGNLVGVPSIRIHVVAKLEESTLHPRRRFPKAIEGVPVDVIQSFFRVRLGCPSAGASHRKKVRPVVGGCSIGRFGEDEFGTLAALAVTPDDSRGVLTCAHVCQMGDTVRQPHRSGKRIGTVSIQALTNEVDAAFVKLNSDCASETSLLGHGAMSNQPLGVQEGDLPVGVQLVGACSGKSRGKVVSTNFSGWVTYPDGERLLRGQLCIEPEGGAVFARSGDSGGAVVVGDQFVAMLVAAGDPSTGGVGLATPMSRVLEELGVRLV